MSQMEKAYIHILDEQEEISEQIEVYTNPDSYQIRDTASYRQVHIPGGCDPVTVFEYAAMPELEMTLYFDTSGYTGVVSGKEVCVTRDVSGETKQFTRLVYVTGSLHAPPLIRILWGPLNFKGVVTSLLTTYTETDESGCPVKAELELHVLAVRGKELHRKASPFESPDRSKYRCITEGSSLWQLAWEEYQDVDKWKVIAAENDITDPLQVRPGTIVRVPPIRSHYE